MLYARSQEIERRLKEVLELVRQGRHSTRTLAETLRVSQPTVSRCLSALRQRGYVIRAVKHRASWSYELAGEQRLLRSGNDGTRALQNAIVCEDGSVS
jgi:biotin operon repressor